MTKGGRRRSPGFLQGIFAEALVVGITGVLIAVAANALSPRGLSWTRNYFPDFPELSVPPSVHPTAQGSGQPNEASVAIDATPELPDDTDSQIENGARQGTGSTQGTGGIPDQTRARIESRGLILVDRDEALQLFTDPRFEREIIIFVDARKDQLFREGHIPGAYQLDRYYPDRYLPEVLPAAQLAETIVVYCTGGECEDSEYAALLLRDSGIPVERLRVYAGGITDWSNQGLPVEMEERLSGILRPSP